MTSQFYYSEPSTPCIPCIPIVMGMDGERWLEPLLITIAFADRFCLILLPAP